MKLGTDTLLDKILSQRLQRKHIAYARPCARGPAALQAGPTPQLQTSVRVGGGGDGAAGRRPANTKPRTPKPRIVTVRIRIVPMGYSPVGRSGPSPF